MTKKSQTSKDAADKVVKNIRRKTRQTYSAEEKIRIVLAGLRGEESISVLLVSPSIELCQCFQIYFVDIDVNEIGYEPNIQRRYIIFISYFSDASIQVLIHTLNRMLCDPAKFAS